MRFALSNNPDHIAGKKKSWYLRGHNRLHRIASSTQRKDKVESGAALEVVFRSCLVVRPNKKDISMSSRCIVEVLLHTFACRRKSVAAARAGCLPSLRHAPLSGRPGLRSSLVWCFPVYAAGISDPPSSNECGRAC